MEGADAAWSLTADTLADLRDDALERLRTTTVVHDPSVVHAPEARVFFGARFDARDRRRDPAWAEFPAAWALAPRVLLAHRGDTHLLGWQGTAGELRALAALPQHAPTAPVGPWTPSPHPEAPARWEALVHAALDAFATGSLEKVVAARREAQKAPGASEVGAVPTAVLAALDDALAGRDGVALGLCPGHGAGVLVGATPECLVRRRGTTVVADALAGSVPRGHGPWEDAAEALRRSDKDLREHGLVRDAVVAALDPWCHAVTHPAEPTVRVLPTLLHLSTRVSGVLRDPDAGDVLALVGVLHPTPAVCGTPREAARAFIAAHESAPRGWYAGPVGWCAATGEGEAMVALRAAVMRGSWAWAYAGAGLVTGSDAAREWRETDAKLGPMRAALGEPSPR